jgi:thiol-disulfide isomerase/thioredoxin
MNSLNRITGVMARACFLLGLASVHAMAADLPPLSHSLTQQVATPAPTLKLKDLDGKLYDLAQLKGQVVLVNFWATWCPPCRREMPSMESLAHGLKGESFTVLAVNVGENPDTIDAFTSQFNSRLHVPILLDTDSTTLQDWDVKGLPTSFLINKQGNIVASAIGGRDFDHPDIARAVRALLKD